MSLSDIADAANHLAALLEKSAPKGLRHPKHAQHIGPARKRIKAVMVRFFERQRKAVLAEVKPKIERELMLYPPTVKESLQVREVSSNGKTFARTLIPASLHPLSFAATGAEESGYNDAITSLIGAAAKGLGASEAAGADYAGEWIANNSLSKLSGGLNGTSIERLQNALATAWDAGGTYDSMVTAITDTFEDFTTTRAELIATTEVADAYNSGRQQIAEDLGFEEHAWETESGDPCIVCEENEDAGFIDIDEDFPSGDDAPTAHPGCLCLVNFRKSSESE